MEEQKKSFLKIENIGVLFSLKPLKDNIQTKSLKKNKKKKKINPYFLFCINRRTIIHVQNPNLTSREVTKILAKEWNLLTYEEKLIYSDQKSFIIKKKEEKSNKNNIL